jgi:hypothetical protein
MNQGKAHKFDCDAGYLVKSPCRDCGTYGMFPDCMDRCVILDLVQTLLSDGRVATTRQISALESYTVQA